MKKVKRTHSIFWVRSFFLEFSWSDSEKRGFGGYTRIFADFFHEAIWWDTDWTDFFFDLDGFFFGKYNLPNQSSFIRW